MMNSTNFLDMNRGAPTAVGVTDTNDVPDAQLVDALARFPTLTEDENTGDGSVTARIETMQSDGVALAKTLQKVSAFMKDVSTSVQNTVNARANQIDRAALAVRTSAPADPEGGEAKYRASAYAGILDGVAEKKSAKADALAIEAQTAATAFDRDIKRLIVRFSYARRPAPADLQASLAFEQMRVQVQAAGVPKAFAHYSALLALEDDEQLDEFEAATSEWLQEVTLSPPHKLTQLIQGGVNANNMNGKVDEIVYQARALVRAYEKRAQERMPRAIAMAQQIMSDLLVPAFRSLCGTSAWDLSADEMYRLRESDSAKPFGLFDIRPGWHMRLVTGRAVKPTTGLQAGR